MKWFKHITDSLDDPFIEDLIFRFGARGYLVFFGTIEIVARECRDFSNFVELSWRFCARKMRLSRKVYATILNFCAKSGRFEVTTKDEVFLIRIPKLSELKDNYTQDKLGRHLEEHSPPLQSKIKSKIKKKIKSEDIPAKAGTPQAAFVDNWSRLYQSETGQPFKTSRKDFILGAKLLKDFGEAEVFSRARILFEACKRRVWPGKAGMADFTLGKLSSQWNVLIPDLLKSKNEAAIDEWLKKEEKNEQAKVC